MTENYLGRGGFGKHFASMYQGSLVGEGPLAFALMGYVIANQKPLEALMSVDMSRVSEERALGVELNPKLLAAIIGRTTEAEVEKEIERLCGPDENSRSEAEDGKRLVRVGTFAYWVVNGRSYREARIADDRKEQNRVAQARHRAKKKRGIVGPLPGERLALEHGIDTREYEQELKSKKGGEVTGQAGAGGMGDAGTEGGGVVHHGGGGILEHPGGLSHDAGGQLGGNSGGAGEGHPEDGVGDIGRVIPPRPAQQWGWTKPQAPPTAAPASPPSGS